MLRLAVAVSSAVLVASACAHAQGYEDDYFKSKKFNGAITVETLSPTKGRDCALDFVKKCKPGEPCVSDLQIGGDAAKQLYSLLKKHGVKSNEVEGDYVATKSEALTCAETDGKYYCTIRYNVTSNSLEAVSHCSGE